jgi:general secretion pathway protein A
MPGVVEIAEPPETPYLGRFQFLEAPFRPAPDLRFVYRSESQARAQDAVVNGLDRGHPLIVVTGDKGTGKTTFCLELSASFSEGTPISVVLNPRIGVAGILQQARADFNNTGIRPRRLQPDTAVPSSDATWRDILDTLAKRGKRGVLVVDDAEEFDPESLDALLALQDGNEPPRLQIVLVGQPGLEDRLQESVGASRREVHREQLAPLVDREVKAYVERRLWIAQGGIAAFSGPVGDLSLARFPRRTVWGPRFSGGAMTLIANASQGNPRMVNTICDQALARASDRSSSVVSERVVRGVARELGLPGAARAPIAVPRRWIAIGAAALAVTAALVTFVSSPRRSADIADEPLPPSSVQPAGEDPQIDRRSFQSVRKSALERAAALSTVPDVKGLLKLRDGILEWAQDTSYDNPKAVKDLLTEVERFTNDARARRLALDREQFLKEAGKNTAR